MAGKPTVVTDEAVELAAELLARRWKKHQVKQALQAARSKAGVKTPISARSFESILARARLAMRLRATRAALDHQIDGIEFLETVVRSKEASFRDRLKAQELLFDTLGIGGKFTATDTTADEKAREIRAALAEMDASLPLRENGRAKPNGRAKRNGQRKKKKTNRRRRTE